VRLFCFFAVILTVAIWVMKRLKELTGFGNIGLKIWGCLGYEHVTAATELTRILRQSQLDGAKTQTQRNKLGQFATPPALAADILKYASGAVTVRCKDSFSRPSFWYRFFLLGIITAIWALSQIVKAVGYEIDPHYGNEAIKLWSDTSLHLNIADFTQATPPNSDEQKLT
jgi:adenine-specific DNA-methyltransferase